MEKNYIFKQNFNFKINIDLNKSYSNRTLNKTITRFNRHDLTKNNFRKGKRTTCKHIAKLGVLNLSGLNYVFLFV